MGEVLRGAGVLRFFVHYLLHLPAHEPHRLVQGLDLGRAGGGVEHLANQDFGQVLHQNVLDLFMREHCAEGNDHNVQVLDAVDADDLLEPASDDLLHRFVLLVAPDQFLDHLQVEEDEVDEL